MGMGVGGGRDVDTVPGTLEEQFYPETGTIEGCAWEIFTLVNCIRV